MKTRSFTTCVFACLFMSSLAMAQTPVGAWKESRHFEDSDTDETEVSTVKVWDSFPNLGLKFRWEGGRNAWHEAEGAGELTWYKESDNGEVIMSTFNGTLKKGMREGRGRLQLRSGATYSGEWKHNLKHGSGIYYYASGESYQGEFENDAMHGSGIYTEADGTTYIGGFVNGQRNGKGRVTLANGRTYDSEWSAGIELPGSLALRAAKLAEAAHPHPVGVTLDHDYMQKLSIESQNQGVNAFLYRSHFANGAIQIEPNFSWLDTYREKGHVGTSETGFDWNVGPVPLILTVNNPGTEPVTISSGRLHVEKSTPDLRPILEINDQPIMLGFEAGPTHEMSDWL